MEWKSLFKSKPKYITVNDRRKVNENKVAVDKSDIAEGKWVKCDKCNEIIYTGEWERNNKVCTSCGHYFRLSASDRINMILDEESFEEFNSGLSSVDPLNFHDLRKYTDRVLEAQEKTGLKEAVLTGKGKIGGNDIVIAVMDFHFMAGSMGSVVGEKITRAAEKAIEEKLPLIIFSCSGGARMQEGMLSLMQMAKTSAAIGRLNNAGLLFISVLTDPTTGGVTASFASLGDIIIAEKGATIGFTGRRVVEQTIKQKLPDTFQKPEFLMEHGLVDMIVERSDLKNTLAKLLHLHKGGTVSNG